MTILLLGASGFLGVPVLRKLMERNLPVRLLGRSSRDWRDNSVRDLRQQGIEVILSDIVGTKNLDRAVRGCSCIINLIGRLFAADENVHSVYVDVVQDIIESAKKNSVERLVHVSCLGASADSECSYLEAKWRSEQLVKMAPLGWTILRPSFLFADRFPLLDVLSPLVKFRLFMPVFGSGLNRLQPVFVEDVAECIVKSALDPDAAGKSYDLAGPDVYTMSELMELIRKRLKINGLVVNIPGSMAITVSSGLSRIIPGSPINLDVARLLLSGSYTVSNAIKEKFALEPLSLDERLETILETFR